MQAQDRVHPLKIRGRQAKMRACLLVPFVGRTHHSLVQLVHRLDNRQVDAAHVHLLRGSIDDDFGPGKRRRDEDPLAMADYHAAGPLQLGDRLTDREPVHPELGGQQRLRRKLPAGPPFAGVDALLQDQRDPPVDRDIIAPNHPHD
jgi:hypothetical protein